MMVEVYCAAAKITKVISLPSNKLKKVGWWLLLKAGIHGLYQAARGVNEAYQTKS